MKTAIQALPNLLRVKMRTASNGQIVQKTPTSPYVVLFYTLLLAAFATWIVPAGQFEHVMRDGISFVVPHSLKTVARHGIGPAEIFMAIAKGMVDSAPIIFVILFTGGTFALLERSGAIHALLGRIGTKATSSDIAITVGICVAFSLLGTIGVLFNSVIAFIPLGLMIARRARLPAVFGVGLIYVGTFCGFNVSVFNPGTTGFSQRLAELPMFSGSGLRAVIYLLFLLATIIFFVVNIRAFRRSPENPRFHLTAESLNGAEADDDTTAAPTLTRRQRWALAFSAASLCIYVAGAIKVHWGLVEMNAMFIAIAIVVGKISGLTSTQISEEFLSGCGKLVRGAFVVGLARAIAIVLHDGYILDPIVESLSEVLAPLHPIAASLGMFVGAAVMHIVISSGSGESAALIPIFTPLSDTLHLTRQVTVQAVLLGEGIMNCVNPTSSVLLGVLAMANIPYGKWVRFVLPLILAWFVICIGALTLGVCINWGPF